MATSGQSAGSSCSNSKPRRLSRTTFSNGPSLSASCASSVCHFRSAPFTFEAGNTAPAPPLQSPPASRTLTSGASLSTTWPGSILLLATSPRPRPGRSTSRRSGDSSISKRDDAEAGAAAAAVASRWQHRAAGQQLKLAPASPLAAHEVGTRAAGGTPQSELPCPLSI